ncbi:Teichoic acid export ATP-binding protein TagH [hydrothermal vent metagenome]|uniref:Teichoic acid export ATP-binding protein TagH n=1 Tax=hydrothermal vent metagenome TaxID=652676 RepID=A0A3B0YV58_9ZZZZ
MGNIAVKVEGIAKLYRIGSKAESHDSLGGAFIDMIRQPIANYRKYKSLYKFDDVATEDPFDTSRSDVLWALKDISFEVEKGGILGIIGHNGAGKSTLLKILSRITPPTKGRIEIAGRVSSLLEVGTGFHPELTGRENVYLNGTVLGMKKREIDRRFDEIIDFSGVETFLDTPVKRYSSGMKVRLAFAVAAHLEPEVLIVDEVLAVGDAEFQKKCIDKMQDVGQQGATVLFVSHNMPSITRMCERAVLLRDGVVLKDAPVTEVVSAYLKADRTNTAERSWPERETAPGGDVARLRGIRLKKKNGGIAEVVNIRESVGLELEYEVLSGGHVMLPMFSFWDDQGNCVFLSVDQHEQWRKRERPPGLYKSTGWVPGNFLAEGMFTICTSLWLMEPRRLLEYQMKDVLVCQVVDDLKGDTARGDWQGPFPGVVRPILPWETITETK